MLIKQKIKIVVLNDVFSVIGTKLRITDKEGNTEEIEVTADMIKRMPDISTPGKRWLLLNIRV